MRKNSEPIELVRELLNLETNDSRKLAETFSKNIPREQKKLKQNEKDGDKPPPESGQHEKIVTPVTSSHLKKSYETFKAKADWKRGKEETKAQYEQDRHLV